MTDFGKFCVLLVVLALGLIIGGNIPHMPPPGQGVKVTPHIFNLAEPIIIEKDNDNWELVPQFQNSSEYPPGERGCWTDCSGHLLDPSEMTCAVFPEHGIKIWKRTWNGDYWYVKKEDMGDILKVILPDGRVKIVIPTDACGIPGRIDFLRWAYLKDNITFTDNSVKVYKWIPQRSELAKKLGVEL